MEISYITISEIELFSYNLFLHCYECSQLIYWFGSNLFECRQSTRLLPGILLEVVVVFDFCLVLSFSSQALKTNPG